MTTKPKPFVPLIVTEPAERSGVQALHPEVTSEGTPLLQEGEVVVALWGVTELGYCHGPINAAQRQRNIKGTLFLTPRRVVVVSNHFAHGSNYRSLSLGGMVTAKAASKVSEHRANAKTRGTFLTAQMRLPWIKQLSYGAPRGPKNERGNLRLVGEHFTSFDEPETFMFLASVEHTKEIEALVDAVIERVRADRLTWSGTVEPSRQHLLTVRRPSSVSRDKLSTVMLPGAYRVSPSSGFSGVESTRSAPSTSVS